MSSFNSPAIEIERPTGQCALTGAPLEPGQPFVATLVETSDAPPPSTHEVKTETAKSPSNLAGLGVKRLDVCWQAWQDGKRPEGMICHWKSTVPQPNEKKKLFVDDAVLMNLFTRLEDTTEDNRRAFRFVLGLILMRKRLLKYQSTERRHTPEGDQEWWWLLAKGEDKPRELFNPKLDEQQIQHVTEQLDQILESEL